MLILFRSVFAPILSLVLVILGNTFFATYLSIFMSLNGETNHMIGLVTSAFFAGFVVGAIWIEKVIIRVGHIRSFSIFASLLTVFIMFHELIHVVELWAVFRFFLGCVCGGNLCGG